MCLSHHILRIARQLFVLLAIVGCFIKKQIQRLTQAYSGDEVGSLMPRLILSHAEKRLVKHIFNFGSVRQDLDAPNQIAKRCLCHGCLKNDCNSNLIEGAERGLTVVCLVSNQ